MSHPHYDLDAASREEMRRNGFDVEFPEGAADQLADLQHADANFAGLKDLRHLLWSSIDNDSSRDLDQVEVCSQEGRNIRVLIGIADVDFAIPRDTPIDRHAASQTTSVYTATRVYPMLPTAISTDLTSLNEGVDRAGIVVEMLIAPDGQIAESSVYQALLHNGAQLTYNAVGPWLEGRAPAPPKVTRSPELQAQLHMQDAAARALQAQRHKRGALEFDRNTAQPVVVNGQVTGLESQAKNRAGELIENFMVAANMLMAETLERANVSSIQRVVRRPERWLRIVEVARRYGFDLPEAPDSVALNAFLKDRKDADPIHYADVSLSVIKLLGPGEYVLVRPGDPDQGHFGLAAHDYTHSTAPNRRFADLVTQRLIKAVLAGVPSPYSDAELEVIAKHCTEREDAARKVERVMDKRVEAVALQPQIGHTFHGVVTGVTPKGVFVRVLHPPAEGRVMQGEHGLDVGDQVQVRLISTDPQRGFIDFAVV